MVKGSWWELTAGQMEQAKEFGVKGDPQKLTLMDKHGYSYDVAHLLTNKKYPWEYKKRGGMSDDQIRAIIEAELKNYI